MNKLVNAIDTIKECAMIARMDVQNALCDVCEKEDIIEEAYEGTPEQLKESFGIEVVQESLIAGAAILAAITAFAEISNHVYCKTNFAKKLKSAMDDVSEIVKDSNGDNDPKKAVKKFRKLKKGLRLINEECNRMVRVASLKKNRYYAREIAEFAKLADICAEIISEKKVTKYRAKKQNDTSVFETQLKEFFAQSGKVLEIADKAYTKIVEKKEDPSGSSNETTPTESDAPATTTEYSVLDDLDTEYFQEFTLIELIVSQALIGAAAATISIISKIGENKKVTSKFADKITTGVKEVSEWIESHKDGGKITDKEFKKLTKSLNKVHNACTDTVYLKRACAKKWYFVDELDEFDKLDDACIGLINAKDVANRRNEQDSSNADLNERFEKFFKQAKVCLKLIDKALGKMEKDGVKSDAEIVSAESESKTTQESFFDLDVEI